VDFEKLMSYQNLVQNNLRQERQMDRKIELLSIINQLTAGPRNLVQKENIFVTAQQHGFRDNETERLLAQLVKDGIIFEDSPGYFKKR
jgi:DNA replicative helicase MCM subunit Mcm2 (Cdc46/Mcm family)